MEAINFINKSSAAALSIALGVQIPEAQCPWSCNIEGITYSAEHLESSDRDKRLQNEVERYNSIQLRNLPQVSLI